MKTILRYVCILVLGVAAPVMAVRADDVAAAKQGIQSRQAKLAAFKQSGAIGEDNRGFVQLRNTADTEAGDLMAAENRDREIVYATVAKETGWSADRVGKTRARKIAESSVAGVWLQKDDGSWHKK